MSENRRRFWLLPLFLSGIFALMVLFRHAILVGVLSLDPVPPLDPAGPPEPGVRWADDYYTVERIDERTFAIGEPRYYQRNFNYLIEGRDRALLFDAGAGHRSIREVAESLTDKPIVFVPSHFHYDHLGDGLPFERIAIVDLPEIRDRVRDGKLTLTWQEHLGAAEGFETPTFTVDEWLTPGGRVELGDRSLEVVYTPGHTSDSISLVDYEAKTVFAGDFLYPGDLFAFLPNSRAGDYVQGAAALLSRIDHGFRIFGAHRLTPPGAPELAHADLRALANTLTGIRDGSRKGQGFYPVRYEVKGEIGLLLEPRPFLKWSPTRPSFSNGDREVERR